MSGTRPSAPPLASSARAVVVLDWGFGDAGKGLATDYLTRHLGASAVVRFNGGAQAGHNVVTPEGRQHCFSQWGAGTFSSGVDTWLGPEVVVHPGALAVEAEHLEGVGVSQPFTRLHIHEECLLITPLHQALGRLRELARGALRHGSCGVGVGEALAASEAGLGLRAGHLLDRTSCLPVLRRLRDVALVALDSLRPRLPRGKNVEAELAHFAPGADERWLERARAILGRATILDEARWCAGLRAHRRVVFEGAQGALLDREHGFYPHTSRGHCTFAPALALAARCGMADAIVRLAVVRSHMVRHGPGPLPSEVVPAPGWARDAHNRCGPWQGSLRYGWPDLVMLRHARRATQGADLLMVTHLDRVQPAWAHAARYRDTAEIPNVAELDLEVRAHLTQVVMTMPATLEPLALDPDAPGRDLAERLAASLETPLGLTSRGPTWRDVELQ